MIDDIEITLSVLVGLPLSGGHRAAEMEIFWLGEPEVPLPDRTGALVLHSRYSLHVQCPWRIVREGVLVIGYRDIEEPRSEQADDPDFDPNEPGTTLREQVMQQFYLERSGNPRRVRRASASEFGDVRVELDDDCALELFADASAERKEHWRLLDLLLGGQFVVGGRGAHSYLEP